MGEGGYVHIHRAAMILCCTPKHVYQLIKEGRLEVIRLSVRGMRVTSDSLQRFIDTNRVIVKKD